MRTNIQRDVLTVPKGHIHQHETCGGSYRPSLLTVWTLANLEKPERKRKFQCYDVLGMKDVWIRHRIQAGFG